MKISSIQWPGTGVALDVFPTTAHQMNYSVPDCRILKTFHT